VAERANVTTLTRQTLTMTSTKRRRTVIPPIWSDDSSPSQMMEMEPFRPRPNWTSEDWIEYRLRDLMTISRESQTIDAVT